MADRRLRLVAVALLLISAAQTGAGEAAVDPPSRGRRRNPHGRLSVPCSSCHTSTSWKPIRQAPDFDHSKTGYPLLGRHRGVDCTSCHTNLVFANTSTRCAQCHADLHRGQFGSSCDRCHTVRGWDASQAALTSGHQNRFPLVLAHAVADCSACHKGAASGQFQGLSTQCYACHAKDFQTTANPNHVTSRFSTDLRPVPHDELLAGRQVRSLADRVRPDGRPRGRRLRRLPREQQLHAHECERRLLVLSHARLPADDATRAT